tara:strand:- start:5213 stop:5485 length:273 start_codon:yes stop_codon:yes gene_type:complete
MKFTFEVEADTFQDAYHKVCDIIGVVTKDPAQQTITLEDLVAGAREKLGSGEVDKILMTFSAANIEDLTPANQSLFVDRLMKRLDEEESK